MRIFDNPEMAELRKTYEPYIDEKYDLVEGTPQKAIDAYNKYFEIIGKMRREEIESWFD
jgi:hypothetical protein